MWRVVAGSITVLAVIASAGAGVFRAGLVEWVARKSPLGWYPGCSLYAWGPGDGHELHHLPMFLSVTRRTGAAPQDRVVRVALLAAVIVAPACLLGGAVLLVHRLSGAD